VRVVVEGFNDCVEGGVKNRFLQSINP
jgi:hypothetical protein